MQSDVGIKYYQSSQWKYIEDWGKDVSKDSDISRFIYHINSLEEIKNSIANNHLVQWIQKKEQRLSNQENLTINYDLSIVRIYASILQRYKSVQHVENGGITPYFNYYQLVYVINEVFKKHIANDDALCSEGIEISVSNSKFYAKKENSKIFILISTKKILGKGSSGVIHEIYDLVTRQFFALKWTQKDLFENEIYMLNEMHIGAKLFNKKINGLSPLPLATFNTISAILTSKHEMSLSQWMILEHSMEERIRMGQCVMQAFKNKEELDIWHGNIKPSNFMITSKGVEIIGWGDATSYCVASTSFTTPKIRSYLYTCELDILNVWEAMANKDSDKMSHLAKIQEEFALAVTLFCIFTGGIYPFLIGNSDILQRKVPLTEKGITSGALMHLNNMGYPSDVTTFLPKLLSHQASERNPY